jgi:excisionase family DNA binding protein
MTSQPAAAEPTPMLYTAEQAAELLHVKASWLRKKATARAIPCTFVGKHLRFSGADLAAIVTAGARKPTTRHR